MTDTQGNPGQAGAAGANATGAASGVGGAAASGAANSATDWIAALDADTRAAVQTKGYKEPADLAKAYFSLEKTIGLDKVALPAKDKDGKRDWSKFDFAALGRPEKAAVGEGGYVFKLPEGITEPDAGTKALQAHMAPLLHKAGVAQWQLDILTEGLNAYGADALKQGQAAAAQAVERATAELKTELGAAFDARRDLANKALRAVAGDQLAELSRLRLDDGSFLLDHPLMFRAFAKVGEALAEDGALPDAKGGGKGAGGFATLTPAAAKAEIDRIMGEVAGNPKHPYLDSKHPEHAALQDRMLRLHEMAAAGRARSAA